jgi:hypothetical protein
MSDLSDYAENLVVKWLLTDESVTRPTAWYVGLYTAVPSDAGGGTEVTGNGYARQAYGASSSGSDADNDADITFTASGGDWGTIVAAGIFDASSGGNLLAWKALAPTVSIVDGVSYIYRAGALIARAA